MPIKSPVTAGKPASHEQSDLEEKHAPELTKDILSSLGQIESVCHFWRLWTEGNPAAGTPAIKNVCSKPLKTGARRKQAFYKWREIGTFIQKTANKRDVEAENRVAALEIQWKTSKLTIGTYLDNLCQQARKKKGLQRL